MDNAVLDYDEDIKRYNDELSELKDPVSSKVYTRNIIAKFYNHSIKQDTVDKMIELCNSKGMSIDHQQFIDFKMIGKNNSSTHVKNLLKDHGMKEGTDYVVDKVAGSKAKKYRTTGRCFMKTLARCKNTEEYADIYVAIFMCSQLYFTDYEKKFTAKRDRREIAELISKLNQTNIELVEIKVQNKTILSNNSDLLEQVEDMNDTMNEMNDKMDRATHTSVIPSENPNKINCFTVLQKTDENTEKFPFSFVRASKINTEVAIERYKKKHPAASIILQLIDPYAVQLCNRIKEKMGPDGSRRILVDRNDFMIYRHIHNMDYTKQNMIDDMVAEHNLRKVLTIPTVETRLI